jgi:hypothetical protein
MCVNNIAVGWHCKLVFFPNDNVICCLAKYFLIYLFSLSVTGRLTQNYVNTLDL